ncbi:MAG: hypothetical protein J6Q84_01550 [Kiritimatiellae bacterium]|nr:hypothetical protein [Kiritimatiellia bacterium]
MESANIVGYQNQDLTGSQYNSVGATFVSAGKDTFKLGDITVEGFQYDTEILQVLSTENAATIAQYVYVTPEWDEEDFDGDGAAVGWWIKGMEGEDEGRADNIEFAPGQAFLANFVYKKAKMTYAGEVKQGATELDFTGKQYVLVANFLPKDIKLGEVAVEGFQYDTEILQVLSASNAATIAQYVYVTPEWDEEDFDGDGAAVGWWIKGMEGEEGGSANDVVWKAGQAMLGNFVYKKAKMTFPSAL